MKLIVGLGNPGAEYEKTRHNAGFCAIDALREHWKDVSHVFPIGKEKHALYEAYEYEWYGREEMTHKEKIIFLKPLSYMNTSGEVIASYLAYTKEIELAHDLWVVHDELALPFGRLKIDCLGSAAGHKGVQNIIDRLKTKEFVRFRIGITPDSALSTVPRDTFVLQKFTKKEVSQLETVFERVTGAIECALSGGIAKAQTLYNIYPKEK